MYPGGVDQLATQRSPSDLPVRRALRGHSEGIAAILPSAQGWILTAGSDGSVLEWQEAILTHPETEGVRKHDEFEYRTGFHGPRNPRALTAIAVSQDGRVILKGGLNGQGQLWDGIEHVLISDRFIGHTEANSCRGFRS